MLLFECLLVFSLFVVSVSLYHTVFTMLYCLLTIQHDVQYQQKPQQLVLCTMEPDGYQFF